MLSREMLLKLNYSQIYESSRMVKALFLKLRVGMKDPFQSNKEHIYVSDYTGNPSSTLFCIKTIYKLAQKARYYC